MTPIPEIKRITADEVIAAYKKTGLSPMSGRWFGVNERNDNKCACPIGALYIAANPDHPRNGIKANNYANRIYSDMYVWWFTIAVDGGRFPKTKDETFQCKKLAYEDGRAVWDAVMDEFYPLRKGK